MQQETNLKSMTPEVKKNFTQIVYCLLQAVDNKKCIHFGKNKLDELSLNELQKISKDLQSGMIISYQSCLKMFYILAEKIKKKELQLDLSNEEIKYINEQLKYYYDNDANEFTCNPCISINFLEIANKELVPTFLTECVPYLKHEEHLNRFATSVNEAIERKKAKDKENKEKIDKICNALNCDKSYLNEIISPINQIISNNIHSYLNPITYGDLENNEITSEVITSKKISDILPKIEKLRDNAILIDIKPRLDIIYETLSKSVVCVNYKQISSSKETEFRDFVQSIDALYEKVQFLKDSKKPEMYIEEKKPAVVSKEVEKKPKGLGIFGCFSKKR